MEMTNASKYSFLDITFYFLFVPYYYRNITKLFLCGIEKYYQTHPPAARRHFGGVRSVPPVDH